MGNITKKQRADRQWRAANREAISQRRRVAWATRTPEKKALDKERRRQYRVLHAKALDAATLRWCHRNRKRRREIANAYSARNRETLRAKGRARCKANRAKYAANLRVWRAANPKKNQRMRRRWYIKNRVKLLARQRSYRKLRGQTDVCFRLIASHRRRICCAVQRASVCKLEKSLPLLGCTVPDYRRYLEALWQPGMSWENYGYRGWHIDHRKPITSFNLTTLEGQQAAFHFSNTQPLWRIDNQRKSAKLNWQPATSFLSVGQPDYQAGQSPVAGCRTAGTQQFSIWTAGDTNSRIERSTLLACVPDSRSRARLAVSRTPKTGRVRADAKHFMNKHVEASRHVSRKRQSLRQTL